MTTLYQYNTFDDLQTKTQSAGASISNLRRQGSFGIGSTQKGEMEIIILDGIVYQVNPDNSVKIANDEVKISYASLTHHHAQMSFELKDEVDKNNCFNILQDKLSNERFFHSIRINGNFKNLKLSSYSDFWSEYNDATNTDSKGIMQIDNIRGSLVSFWTPSLYQGIAPAGFHFHFISKDRSFGGHVVDFTLDNAEVKIGRLARLEQDFPSESNYSDEVNYAKLKESLREICK